MKGYPNISAASQCVMHASNKQCVLQAQSNKSVFFELGGTVNGETPSLQTFLTHSSIEATFVIEFGRSNKSHAFLNITSTLSLGILNFSVKSNSSGLNGSLWWRKTISETACPFAEDTSYTSFRKLSWQFNSCTFVKNLSETSFRKFLGFYNGNEM